MALEADLKRFFLQAIFNEDPDEVIAMLRHPRALATFSDSGAHVSQICDSSLQTYVLAHWVREQGAMTLEHAIRKMTFDIACFFGLKGRGLLREGYAADVVVFDPDTVVPDMPVLVSDLPTGARRLLQTASGVSATIVNDTEIDGDQTATVTARVPNWTDGLADTVVHDNEPTNLVVALPAFQVGRAATSLASSGLTSARAMTSQVSIEA